MAQLGLIPARLSGHEGSVFVDHPKIPERNFLSIPAGAVMQQSASIPERARTSCLGLRGLRIALVLRLGFVVNGLVIAPESMHLAAPGGGRVKILSHCDCQLRLMVLRTDSMVARLRVCC